MFNNVGIKCMHLAKFCCWLGITASVLAGIVLMVLSGSAKDPDRISILATGLTVLIAGPLFSWIASLGLYAVGEAAENSAIAANLAVKADLERSRGSGAEAEPAGPETGKVL